MTLHQFRIGLALVGFGLAVLGAALRHRTIVWVAIAVLIVSLLVRIYLRGQHPDRPS